MKKIKQYQVDAFTSRQFKGNPAAICLLDESLSPKLMQSIAAENNLAETAFLVKNADDFDLRWFTPTVEVDLCGHATLASAHVLFENGFLKEGEFARFYTKSGLLTAIKKNNWIELDFPASFEDNRSLPEQAAHALNANITSSVYSETRYIVELSSLEEVYNCKPDFRILKDFDPVVVTSRGTDSSPYDFISRSFAPSYGIDEDPVTGSSHCCLATYWAKRLNKTEMFAYQASQRGGEVRVQLVGNRVLFSGQAVTVIDGHFLLHD